MTTPDPMAAGWGPSIDTLADFIAHKANKVGVGHQSLNKKIGTLRAKHAKSKEVSEHYFAGMMGYGLRHARNILEGIQDTTGEDFSLEALLLILIDKMEPGTPIKEDEAQGVLEKKFRARYKVSEFPNVPALAVFQLGEAKGVFTSELLGRGRWKSVRYVRTRTNFEYEEPQTMEQMCGRLYRSGLISISWVRQTAFTPRSLSLGKLGLQYFLCNVLNTASPDAKKPDKPCGLRRFFAAADRAMDDTEKRTKGTENKKALSFGTLMTICWVGPDTPLKDSLLSVEWAKARYMLGMAQLWPFQMPLDDLSKDMFKSEWDEIKTALETECKKAEHISTNETNRMDFVVNFGYGNL